jgi:hypothetical protein
MALGIGKQLAQHLGGRSVHGGGGDEAIGVRHLVDLATRDQLLDVLQGDGGDRDFVAAGRLVIGFEITGVRLICE